jgi:hypothetical protein
MFAISLREAEICQSPDGTELPINGTMNGRQLRTVGLFGRNGRNVGGIRPWLADVNDGAAISTLAFTALSDESGFSSSEIHSAQ